MKVDGVLKKQINHVVSRRKSLINFKGQYRECLRADSFQKIFTKQQRPLTALSPFSLERKRRSDFQTGFVFFPKPKEGGGTE